MLFKYFAANVICWTTHYITFKLLVIISESELLVLQSV